MEADTDSANAARKFICSYCNASYDQCWTNRLSNWARFRRSGHLARHKRSRTRPKPREILTQIQMRSHSNAHTVNPLLEGILFVICPDFIGLIFYFDMKGCRTWGRSPNFRTLHGSTDSSKMYSKGAKSEALKKGEKTTPQPSESQNVQATTVHPTLTAAVLLPHPAYDPFSLTSTSESVVSTTSMDASISQSPSESDIHLLDPQLLALQTSRQKILHTFNHPPDS